MANIFDGYLPSDEEKSAFGDAVRDRLGQATNVIGNLAPKTNEDAANMLTHMVPGYGNYLSGKDAVSAYNQGDWRNTALSGLGAMPLPAGILGGIFGKAAKSSSIKKSILWDAPEDAAAIKGDALANPVTSNGQFIVSRDVGGNNVKYTVRDAKSGEHVAGALVDLDYGPPACCY